MRIIALLALASLSALSMAKDFADDFAVVLATEKTEARFGKMPFDRAHLARAIELAARGGAKGVVVKFFLDRPRDPDGDARLAHSMSLLPVILQARIDDAAPAPHPFPGRFTVGGSDYASAVHGHSGWIPLPLFADKSRDICFVDFSASPIPLIETYRGRAVKSLMLCAVELAIGSKMTLLPSKQIQLGAFTARLDALNRAVVSYPSSDTLKVLELAELLDGTLPKEALKGKVVILGYDGPNIPVIATGLGNRGAHRAFILLLKSFYETGS